MIIRIIPLNDIFYNKYDISKRTMYPSFLNKSIVKIVTLE